MRGKYGYRAINSIYKILNIKHIIHIKLCPAPKRINLLAFVTSKKGSRVDEST